MLILFANGCRPVEQGDTEPPLARVGDQILTRTELQAWEAAIHTEPVTEQMRTAFIRAWVENAALVYAAGERGLHDDAWVATRADDLQRQLLVARLIELESSASQSISIARLRDYYAKHATEFVWPETRLVVEYWQSSNRQALEARRETLTGARPGPAQPGEFETVSQGSLTISEVSDTAGSLYRTLHNLPLGGISNIRQLSHNFFLFRLLKRHDKGTPQHFEDVSDVIARRVEAVERSSLRHELASRMVEDLRRRGKLEWNPPRNAVDEQ
ncbi:MAG: peptidyl-prolyl cis-trans isomerase [Calditrichaeota bacterium]|nr:peptidyl-prolyl cis-trans isomerase [Calditrichota bacterium]